FYGRKNVEGDKRALPTLEPRLVVVISAVFHNQSWLGSGKRPFDIRIKNKSLSAAGSGITLPANVLRLFCVRGRDGGGSLKLQTDNGSPKRVAQRFITPLVPSSERLCIKEQTAKLSDGRFAGRPASRTVGVNRFCLCFGSIKQFIYDLFD
ncbi:MAG: hypothetical protein IKP40_11180, partial [Clostridia bacterium]|nr:hypothetical protein [Clostridia bacterium]